MNTYSAGSIIYRMFNTHKADGTPITLAGTPAISVYKDDGTTQSTTGVTLTVDFDALTGLHNIKIDTSADGTFYATGHDFSIVITTGTVDGVSVVGTEVGRFRLGNTPADVLAVHSDAPAAENLEKACDGTGYNLGSGYIVAASVTAAVTAGTVSDKSGYALTQVFPTNFEDLAITNTTGMVTVGTNTDKSGYTASTVSDKTGYALTQVFPTNFADLAITASTGKVTVGTNSDKSGYALTTAPPTAAQIDTQLSGTHGAGAWGGSAGSGAVTWTYTVTNSITGLPISGVFVEASTTITGSNVVASGTTDAFGVVTFYLDPGTYYIFCMKSGYNFTNPDMEVVT